MSGFDFRGKIDSIVNTIKADKNLLDGLVFVFSAIVLLVIFFSLLQFIPLSVENVLVSYVTSGVIILAKVLGLSARVVPENEIWQIGNFISIDGFVFGVVFGCVAINYIIIFLVGIITYPAPIKERLFGVLFGLPLVIFLNLFRIVFIGWFGSKYPDQVEFVHQVLWEWTYFFAVVAVWWIWISYGGAILNGWPAFSLKVSSLKHYIRLRFIALVMLFITIFIGHSLITKIYMYFLASVSAFIFWTFGQGSGIISPESSGISVSGWVTTVPSVMEICLLIGFTICFSNIDGKFVFIKKFLVGFALIVFLHFLIIVVTYIDLRDSVPNGNLIAWFNSVLPITPFFIWLFLNASDTISDRLLSRLRLDSKDS